MRLCIVYDATYYINGTDKTCCMLCQALGSTPSQVEVTLVTGRREETVRERLTRASDHISLDQLRKICVVSMPV